MSKRFASMWSPQSPNSAMVKTHQQTLMEQLGIAGRSNQESCIMFEAHLDNVHHDIIYVCAQMKISKSRPVHLIVMETKV